MALELELRSLAGHRSAFFQWPLPPMNDETEPTNEVIETMRLVCEEESRELPQLRLELDHILRDYDTKSYQSMKHVCDRYNQVIEEILQKDSRWSEQRRLRCRPSVRLLRHIIQQCYNRAVVDPEKLNQYEPFSAGVYGETSFELIDQMINTINFSEYDQFIDLGSGVGQVVLQVAAATNCKSCYGIEKANWPAQYAEQMAYEFRNWMEFYGKTHSDFELVKGDFLAESHRDMINTSTVIFVNNFAFGPGVDHQLKERFHDLREGTKIVSSMEFRPFNMQISERNLSDIGAIMTVQELSPLRGPVSWTYKPVAYFLHTIDRTQLENYFKDRQEGNKSYGQHRQHRNHRSIRRKKGTESGDIERRNLRGMNQKEKPSLRPRHVSRGGGSPQRSPHTPIRLIATLQVSENRDEDKKRSSRAARSLGFGLEKPNGLRQIPQVKTNGVLQGDRLKHHIQKLKMSMGLRGESERNRRPTDEGGVQTPNACEPAKDRACEGKRKRTASGLPESKRPRIMVLDDEGKRPADTGSQTLNGMHKPRDATNAGKHRMAKQTPDSKLAPEGILRERKTPDAPQGNVEERVMKRNRLKLLDVAGVGQKKMTSYEKCQEVLKVSDTNRQKIPSKLSADKLPQALSGVSNDATSRIATRKRTSSEILSKAGGEENACVRLATASKGEELLTPKSTNRWLFDIRLSSSPVMHHTPVEGQSSSVVGTKSDSQSEVKSETVASNENSFSSDNGSNAKSAPLNGRRIHLVAHPAGKRIHIKSHPSHAGRGFATPRRKCANRIESDDSSGEATPSDDNEGIRLLDEQVGEMEDEADDCREPSAEPKAEKETTVDGELDENCRLANSEPDESMRSPCWSDTEEEFDDAELDEALDEFYDEAGRINEMGYVDTEKFDVDWMRLESEKLLSRAVPLPETEPISGSSDVTDPPAFFPPGNADGVTAWLLSQGRHAPDYDYKTVDWFPSFHNAQGEAGSTLPPIYVSLPRVDVCRDFGGASCPASISSIPISLPREAVQFGYALANTRPSPKSQTSPGSVHDSKSPFGLKLDQSVKTEHGSDSESSQPSRESSRVGLESSCFGRKSSEDGRRSCRRKSESSRVSCDGVSTEDAVVPLTLNESTPLDASAAAMLSAIPVSLPKEALMARHSDTAVNHSDAATLGNMVKQYGNTESNHGDMAMRHRDATTYHGDMVTRRGGMANKIVDIDGDNRTSGGIRCSLSCTRRCCSSADDRSCTSFSGSTLSYGNAFPVEDQFSPVEVQPRLGEGRPQMGESEEVIGNRLEEAFDEEEVPAALLQLLDSFKSQYMGLLRQLKSPSQSQDLLRKIKEEEDRKATGLARIEELSKEILQLESESVNLLRARSAEIGIEACSREQLFDEANHVVLRNRCLQLQAIHLHHQVAVEQEKLFQKYREFSFDETTVSLLLRNRLPVSTATAEHPMPDSVPEGNSPSYNASALSSSSSPQSLDRALLTSDLSLDKQPGLRIEVLGDLHEIMSIMPKLNRSVDLDDSPQIANAVSSSRAGSPELDMPLLMPELDPAPSNEPSDAETMGCVVGMSIPVKLPLRQLLRHKKPPGLSVIIPTSDSLGYDDAGNFRPTSPVVPLLVPPRPASPREERANMYSPISQASDTENQPSMEDCGDEKVNDVMPCFSPISSPGSARSTTSEHLANPGDMDRFLLPVSEASLLQALPTRYPTPNYSSGWELYPGGMDHRNAACPWTTDQFLRTDGMRLNVEDPVDEDKQLVVNEPGQSQKRHRKKLSSPRQPCSSYGNASRRTFINEDLSAREVFVAEEVFDARTRSCRGNRFENGLSSETAAPSLLRHGAGPRRSDGDVRQMASFSERSISVPLDGRADHLVTGERFVAGNSQDVTTWQCDETMYQDDYGSNVTRVDKNETASRIVTNFNDVAAAVCKRLTQNSARQLPLGPDPSRQLDSRSDSRDSGLGKESEADYDRGLVNRNNAALLAGTLDSGVSSPRVMNDRSSRSSQLHPLTLVDPGAFPWRPGFPSQTAGPSDAYDSQAFVKERYAPSGFVGDGFQDHLPVSMFADDRRPRSAKSSGFNQTNNRRPSTGFSRSNSSRRFHDSNDGNDISRTAFCGGENRVDYSLLPQSTTSPLPTTHYMGGGQSRKPSPAEHASATSHKTQATGLLRVADRPSPKDLRLSNFDHFPNAKAFDSKWPSSLTADRSLLERDYSSRVQQVGEANNTARRQRFQDPNPAPNCRFELDQGYPSTFLNHPMCGFAPNLRFNAYPSHLFGGAPSFHSISNNAFAKDRQTGTVDYRQGRVPADRFGYANPTEKPLFQRQQSSKRCDGRLPSHLNRR